MDRDSGDTHKAQVKMTSCLHIGLLCLVVVVEGLPYDVQTCADVDGKPQFFDGTQCKPCPTCRRGYGLSEICGNDQGVNAVCRVCPEGHFSDDDSMEKCRSCRICSDTMEDAVPCTSTSDRQCGQCSCGYFRYQERDDQCARCADENHRHLYDECSRPCPTPTPSPTPSTQEPVTTENPSEVPTTSLDPLVIIVIVVLGLGLIVILIVVICLCRKNFLQCLGLSRDPYSHVKQVIYQPEDGGNIPYSCPNIPDDANLRKPVCNDTMAEATQQNGTRDEPQRCQTNVDDGPKVITDHPQGGKLFIDNDNSDTESGDSRRSRDSGTQTDLQTGFHEAEIDSKLKQAPVATKGMIDEPQTCQKNVDDGRKVSKEARQGATPFFDEPEDNGLANGSGGINSRENPTGNSDTEPGDSSKRGSRHSGTQTELQTEIQEAEFNSKLEQALVATKDIPLDSMHREDIDLLNLRLQEKPELVERNHWSFHYGRLAELFGFSACEIRAMYSAQEVLDCVVARKKERFTVANLLEILEKSGKCYHVVWKLAEQIVERQQH